MKNLKEFKSWVRSYPEQLLCHFYQEEGEKQYYNKTDYAYFNLFSKSREWVVKGTPRHGITSKGNKPPTTPCLNCYSVKDEKGLFFKALRELDTIRKKGLNFGIIFDKHELIESGLKVIDVSIKPPNPPPPPELCHYYDRAQFRRGTLDPFNNCDVVRIEISKSELYGLPIISIPNQAIKAVLVKSSEVRAVKNILNSKGMSDIKVFSLL